MEAKKILIVEDTAPIRMLLKHILHKEGAEILEASHGGEAMVMLEKNEIDLIILDIMMPVMNGIEFLDQARGKISEKNIPVLMLSALEDQAKIITCIELGAKDYLLKPIDRDILIDKVNNLISQNSRPYAEAQAEFEIFLKRINRDVTVTALSENHVNIMSESPLELPSCDLIEDSVLLKLAHCDQGMIIRFSAPVQIDGKFLYRGEFVGLHEKNRSKIRSYTIRGNEYLQEQINEQ